MIVSVIVREYIALAVEFTAPDRKITYKTFKILYVHKRLSSEN